MLFVTKRKYNVVTIVRVFNFVEVPTWHQSKWR